MVSDSLRMPLILLTTAGLSISFLFGVLPWFFRRGHQYVIPDLSRTWTDRSEDASGEADDEPEILAGPTKTKKRLWVLNVYLAVIILVELIVVVAFIKAAFNPQVAVLSRVVAVLMLVILAASLTGAGLLIAWQRIGFTVFAVANVVEFLVLSVCFRPGQAVANLISIAFLYLLLHANGHDSAWSQLESPESVGTPSPSID